MAEKTAAKAEPAAVPDASPPPLLLLPPPRPLPPAGPVASGALVRLRLCLRALEATAALAGSAEAHARLKGPRAYRSGVARGRLRDAAAGPDEGGPAVEAERWGGSFAGGGGPRVALPARRRPVALRLHLYLFVSPEAPCARRGALLVPRRGPRRGGPRRRRRRPRGAGARRPRRCPLSPPARTRDRVPPPTGPRGRRGPVEAARLPEGGRARAAAGRGRLGRGDRGGGAARGARLRRAVALRGPDGRGRREEAPGARGEEGTRAAALAEMARGRPRGC